MNPFLEYLTILNYNVELNKNNVNSEQGCFKLLVEKVG